MSDKIAQKTVETWFGQCVRAARARLMLIQTRKFKSNNQVEKYLSSSDGTVDFGEKLWRTLWANIPTTSCMAEEAAS
jgi:hypothetical protein